MTFKFSDLRMLYTEAKSKMERGERGLESWCMIMDGRMRDNGRMTEDTERDSKDTVMQTLTRVIFVEARLMDLEFIDGRTEKYTRVSGSTDRKTDKAPGKVKIINDHLFLLR